MLTSYALADSGEARRGPRPTSPADDSGCSIAPGQLAVLGVLVGDPGLAGGVSGVSRVGTARPRRRPALRSAEICSRRTDAKDHGGPVRRPGRPSHGRCALRVIKAACHDRRSLTASATVSASDAPGPRNGPATGTRWPCWPPPSRSPAARSPSSPRSPRRDHASPPGRSALMPRSAPGRQRCTLFDVAQLPARILAARVLAELADRFRGEVRYARHHDL